MDTTIIIASGALLSCAISAYFIWKLYSKVALLSKNINTQFSEMNIDSKLSTMFSQNSNNKSVDELTKMVFNNIKNKYNLEAKSYSSVIEEIKIHPDIAADLKEVLIEFFNEIVRISYRAEVISEVEKEDLKNKIKLILQILN